MNIYSSIVFLFKLILDEFEYTKIIPNRVELYQIRILVLEFESNLRNMLNFNSNLKRIYTNIYELKLN